jgi:hypothetical protein
MPQPQGGIENMKKRNWNEKRKFCILDSSKGMEEESIWRKKGFCFWNRASVRVPDNRLSGILYKAAQ